MDLISGLLVPMFLVGLPIFSQRATIFVVQFELTPVQAFPSYDASRYDSAV